MAIPKSNTLFHFTKSLDTLKSILHYNFHPVYCLEDVSWLALGRHSFIAFPLVCFCDIPIGRISDHVNFYGNYGVGMSKQWGLENGLNPVLYLSEESNPADSIRTAFRAALKLRADFRNDEYLDSIRRLAGYMKMMIGTMLVEGKSVQKEFYMENEWRYIPRVKDLQQYLTKDQYDDSGALQQWNDQAKTAGKLKFSPDDVRYIFVARDADIPGLVNFINRELDFHPSASLKLLMTRITSLDHIQDDI